MKVNEILKYNSILSQLIDDNELNIDALIKFKFLGMIKQFETVAANFDKIRNEKILELGSAEVDDEGNETGNVVINKDDKETIQKLNDELGKILDSDTNVEIKKIKAEDIMNSGLPIKYLVELYDIIEE